jgi:hypothetical protein
VKHDGPLFAGLDWASKTHAVCVVDDHSQIVVRFEIPNTGKTFAGLIKRLIKLQVAGGRSNAATGPWSRHCWTPTCAPW